MSLVGHKHPWSQRFALLVTPQNCTHRSYMHLHRFSLSASSLLKLHTSSQNGGWLMLFSIAVVITSDTFPGLSSTAVWMNRRPPISHPLKPAPRHRTAPGCLMQACFGDEVHEALHARGCLGRQVKAHSGRGEGEGNRGRKKM